jgi:hypothetical protein
MVSQGIRSPQIKDSYTEFLEFLKKKTLFKNNCTKIYNQTGKEEILSSPYVAAIAARILMTMPSHNIKNEILVDAAKYLMGCMDENGLIGFLYPNHHRFDLDTLAVCYAFLYEMDRCKIEDRLPAILDIFSKHKDAKTGAYFTWIEKDNNNIDYFVNMNVRFFFWTIGKEDNDLDNYLISNLDDFINNGSPYFRDISFPLILATVYGRYFYYDGQGGIFQNVLDRLFVTDEYRELLSKIKTIVGNNRIPVNDERVSLLNQYFNSRNGVYISNLLDLTLGFYFRN